MVDGDARRDRGFNLHLQIKAGGTNTLHDITLNLEHRTMLIQTSLDGILRGTIDDTSKLNPLSIRSRFKNDGMAMKAQTRMKDRLSIGLRLAVNDKGRRTRLHHIVHDLGSRWHLCTEVIDDFFQRHRQSSFKSKSR